MEIFVLTPQLQDKNITLIKSQDQKIKLKHGKMHSTTKSYQILYLQATINSTLFHRLLRQFSRLEFPARIVIKAFD